MASSSTIKFIFVVALPLMLFLLLAPDSEADISWRSDMIKDLRPCVNYLVDGTGAPPSSCCAGACALASAASSSTNKKTACECIKSAAQKINPNEQLAQALPAKRRITLPVTVFVGIVRISYTVLVGIVRICRMTLPVTLDGIARIGIYRI
ncbi:hypothetical protein SLA2020_139110 [Shorea laevis]